MARNKLNHEQRETLLMWLAADYDTALIRQWLKQREWPEVTKRAFSHYRKRYRDDIERRRTERRSAALITGLALKEERVERLKQHADALEVIKWLPDDKGKLHNEKAWRETLDDIAKELGDRKQTVGHGGSVTMVMKGYVGISPDDWDSDTGEATTEDNSTL